MKVGKTAVVLLVPLVVACGDNSKGTEPLSFLDGLKPVESFEDEGGQKRVFIVEGTWGELSKKAEDELPGWVARDGYSWTIRKYNSDEDTASWTIYFDKVVDERGPSEAKWDPKTQTLVWYARDFRSKEPAPLPSYVGLLNGLTPVEQVHRTGWSEWWFVLDGDYNSIVREAVSRMPGWSARPGSEDGRFIITKSMPAPGVKQCTMNIFGRKEPDGDPVHATLWNESGQVFVKLSVFWEI